MPEACVTEARRSVRGLRRGLGSRHDVPCVRPHGVMAVTAVVAGVHDADVDVAVTNLGHVVLLGTWPGGMLLLRISADAATFATALSLAARVPGHACAPIACQRDGSKRWHHAPDGQLYITGAADSVRLLHRAEDLPAAPVSFSRDDAAHIARKLSAV